VGGPCSLTRPASATAGVVARNELKVYLYPKGRNGLR